MLRSRKLVLDIFVTTFNRTMMTIFLLVNHEGKDPIFNVSFYPGVNLIKRLQV